MTIQIEVHVRQRREQRLVKLAQAIESQIKGLTMTTHTGSEESP